MKTPPPLSPELEALLAPHRKVLPLAPSVEARAIARASAIAAESPAPAAVRVFGPPRLVFAAAAALVLALGAGAYAARGWIAAPPFRAPTGVAPLAPSNTTPPRRAVVSAGPEVDTPATIAPEPAPRRRGPIKTHAAPALPSNAELQLLRLAREDVTRGDFASALAVIGEHSRRFRNGSLVEEREALRVKVFAGLGRPDEAQRAAAAFHRRFPHSAYLSTFERAKETDR
jgi:hypothetical protein